MLCVRFILTTTYSVGKHLKLTFYEVNNMSMCDVFSCWRCPNCNKENIYNLTWQHYFVFEEYPDDKYSRETCESCEKEYYINSMEPNPIYLYGNEIIKCKNDFVENPVIDIGEKLTIVSEYYTD